MLDLFCGAGGAAMGYHRAGFDVVGVDIEPQPHYPFAFIQGDALGYLTDLIDAWELSTEPLPFDAVHASPPCQAYSVLGRRWKGRTWPDLLGATRNLLIAAGLPYIIENVPGAPINGQVMMCGGALLPVVTGDDGVQRQVRRHRYFEANWPMLGHPCHHIYQSLGVYGNGRWDNTKSSHRGGYQGDKRENAEGMAIGWMTRDELSEAIPPAYTEFIGAQLLSHIEAQVAA